MIRQVTDEIDEIISLLEAQIPCNINNPENQRLEKRLRKSLADYFKLLSDSFPYQQLDRLYHIYVKESLAKEVGDILDSLLVIISHDLTYRLNGHLVAIYLTGSAEMISWGKTKGGIPIAYEGPPIDEAIRWAEKHCAKLVKAIDEETKSQLAKIISDGIKNKRGIPGLSRDIRKALENMSKYRSELIARTETNDALSQVFMDRAHELGIEAKEWITADPCPTCAMNGADGVIPIDDAFSSGDLRPPAHPNCCCALAPARLSR